MKLTKKNELLRKLNKLHNEATPGPWSGHSNIPFYIVLDKPAPSLSSDDTEGSRHWRCEDALLVLFLRNNLEAIIEALNEKD